MVGYREDAPGSSGCWEGWREGPEGNHQALRKQSSAWLRVQGKIRSRVSQRNGGVLRMSECNLHRRQCSQDEGLMQEKAWRTFSCGRAATWDLG